MSHPGNDRLHDQVNDTVANYKVEWLYTWLEGQDGGDRFLGWLMAEYPAKARHELFLKFLDHKDSEKFYTYATDRALEALTSESD